MNRRLSVAGAIGCALLAAGCTRTGTAGPSPMRPAGPVVEARTLAPYGRVLTTPSGDPLYVFVPDAARRVTCTGSCAQVWPPVRPAGSPAQTAGSGANARLVGSDPDPDGGRVVTYSGWPLYTYVSDPGPGYASGEGLDLDGGLWYLIGPGGRVAKAAR